MNKLEALFERVKEAVIRDSLEDVLAVCAGMAAGAAISLEKSEKNFLKTMEIAFKLAHKGRRAIQEVYRREDS